MIDTEQEKRQAIEARNNKKSQLDKKNNDKNILRQFMIYAISLSIVLSTVLILVKSSYKKYIMAVDPKDKSETVVEIPMATSARGIGDILYEHQLIRNKGVFRILIDLSDKASKIKAGKYKFSKSMNLNEIIDGLTTGDAFIPQKKFTIPEGRNIHEIASALEQSKKFSFTADDFIKEASDIDKYAKEFSFLKDIPQQRKEGKYAQFPLEGYLFPETYFVDEDATAEDIIRVMLKQFENVYRGEYKARADELGLTTDQVVSLASIIQSEAKLKDEFPKISAVFHNRIKKNMALEACSTIQYVTSRKSLVVTTQETKIDSKYNTYKYKGLPIGPICCPGELAIRAALYPDEEFMDAEKPYLYFVLKDPNEGSHAFNYDYKAHLQDKKKYESQWQN
ncbi:MAG: endolytic transglycosylase MltG [Xylanivirga thermophila]|jgi:UPF0755 protein|uniref:endolytic transglycosylase MltG n=1 Tax=Xylanivirga thermophila TaxID=2496273 RepID=UPI0039F631B2